MWLNSGSLGGNRSWCLSLKPSVLVTSLSTDPLQVLQHEPFILDGINPPDNPRRKDAILILQMGKLRFREVKPVTQNHIAFIKGVESVQSGSVSSKVWLPMNILDQVLSHTANIPIQAEASSADGTWEPSVGRRGAETPVLRWRHLLAKVWS